MLWTGLHTWDETPIALVSEAVECEDVTIQLKLRVLDAAVLLSLYKEPGVSLYLKWKYIPNRYSQDFMPWE